MSFSFQLLNTHGSSASARHPGLTVGGIWAVTKPHAEQRLQHPGADVAPLIGPRTLPNKVRTVFVEFQESWTEHLCASYYCTAYELLAGVYQGG